MTCHKKGDRLRIKIGKKWEVIVFVQHSDFPGYLDVAWPHTRHVSRVRKDWVEKLPPRGSHLRV